jgi:hypothetical protein
MKKFRVLFELKILFLIVTLFFLSSAYAAPADDFVTTWRTTTAGESITIPVQGVSYNYAIDCNNDGTFEQATVTGNGICTFATA